MVESGDNAMSSFAGPMLTFVALCLVARFSYSLNDVFIGRLARRHGRMEVAAFRGVSLGVSMAPWLLLVPAVAWGALAAHAGELLLTVAVTAVANILQLHAARFLPFGLRAALMLSTMATCSVFLGWSVLGERLTPLQVGLCLVLIGSGVAVALGSYGVQEIEIDVPRGAVLTLLAATLMACAVFGVKRLAHETHPLLTAWAWEFGSGLILLGPVLWRARGPSVAAAVRPRFWTVAAAALPTALASGASVLALNFGELGLWGALGATQILFTASLGALWHREVLGLRYWLCMLITGSAVAALALAGS
jgi:drug/metabolite transporter (DMT)-like permease